MSLKRYADVLPTTYHYLSASCFSIFNQHDAVPVIFKAALNALPHQKTITGAPVSITATGGSSNTTNLQIELHLARQFRESLLRAGLFGGMSRAINSLQELHKEMPAHLREEVTSEDRVKQSVNGSDLLSSGRGFLDRVYGPSQAKHIEKALYTLSPRLGFYAVPLVYGAIYADTSVLSTREACVLMFMCNMAVDTPKQAIGHIDSSKNQGATTNELLEVGMMVRSIAELYGIKLKHWEAIMERADSDEVNDKNPYEL